MDLLNILKEDGFSLEWAASTYGGEYKGPCPFCGGEDRFCVWPKQGDGGRYWCRQCEKSGGSIEYLGSQRKMSYIEIYRYLGLPTKLKERGPLNKSAFGWVPRETKVPNNIWQEKALHCLRKAEVELWSGTNGKVRQWLYDRGLTDSTIKAAQLGWRSKDEWVSRRDWQLQEIIQKGKRNKLWLPSGLVIPYIHNNQILRLRIRRFNFNDKWGKYILISGSDTRAMHWAFDRKVYLVVESEIDGLLLRQEASDLIGIIALGSAQIRPDQETHKALSKANLIAVALDSDEAGARQTWWWWLKNYKQAKWWPIPLQYGKDPSEAFKNGLDLRSWVKAAIDIKHTDTRLSSSSLTHVTS